MLQMRRAFLIFSLLLAGCLEVESMEVQIVADRARDRLDVMIVSRGVFSSAANAQNLQKDLADLLKCRDVAAVPIPGIGVADLTRQEEDARWQDNIEFLDIEAGTFFVDEQGRLSFYQFARIHRAKEWAALVRQRMVEQWRTEAKTSRATSELLEAAMRDELEVFSIDGAGFVVRRPLAEEDHRNERNALWSGLVRAVEKAMPEKDGDERPDVTERGLMQMLRDNDVAMVRRKDRTDYYVGTQGADVCAYRVRGEPYQDNLLEALVATEPRPPAVTQALLDEHFAAFRDREARMPAVYVAARQRAAEARKQSRK